MSEKDIVRVSLYLPADLKEKIQQIAKCQRCTMNALIVEWCNEKANNGSLEECVQEIKKRVEALEKAVFKK